MATGPSTLLTDVIVPEVYARYVIELTMTKSRLIQSGVLARDPLIDRFLAGGGSTFHMPMWNDLDDDADDVPTDDPADILALSVSAGSPSLPSAFLDAIPAKIDAHKEIVVRLNRSKSWASSDLLATLAGSDPMMVAVSRGGAYWARRFQDIFIATWKGVAKDNGVNDSGDYANVISATTYTPGVTDFSAEAFLDATLTLGDADDEGGILMVHSVVYNRMRQNNLIDFIPDARGEVRIPTFLGYEVIVDDSMPTGTATILANGTAGNAGCYESWIFKRGAMGLGIGMPKVPVEVERHARAGNGAGQDVLTSRQMLAMHPRGHSYIGTAPEGGPSNEATTHNLNIATSWNRVASSRKHVGFCRLVTRES